MALKESLQWFRERARLGRATRPPPSPPPALLFIRSYVSCAFGRSCCFAMVRALACRLLSPSRFAGVFLAPTHAPTKQPQQLKRTVFSSIYSPPPPPPPPSSLHPQLLCAVPLPHRVRGVVRARAVAVHVRAHHVPRGRQVRGAVGGPARALPPSSVRGRHVLMQCDVRHGKSSGCFIGCAATLDGKNTAHLVITASLLLISSQPLTMLRILRRRGGSIVGALTAAQRLLFARRWRQLLWHWTPLMK